MIEHIPEHQHFKLGQRSISNLKELSASIDKISDDEFNHHVSAENNDFVNWIKDVIMDMELATKLEGVTNKKEMSDILHKHIEDAQPKSDHDDHETKEENTDIEKQQDHQTEENPPEEKKQGSAKKVERSEHKSDNDQENPISSLCHKYTFCMAKEFLGGLILGIVLGLILAKTLGI